MRCCREREDLLLDQWMTSGGKKKKEVWEEPHQNLNHLNLFSAFEIDWKNLVVSVLSQVTAPLILYENGEEKVMWRWGAGNELEKGIQPGGRQATGEALQLGLC